MKRVPAGSTPLKVPWLASPTASMFSRTRRRWTSSWKNAAVRGLVYPLLAGSIDASRMWSRLKPMSAARRFCSVRANSPAPVTSRIVNAIWTTVSTSRESRMRRIVRAVSGAASQRDGLMTSELDYGRETKQQAARTRHKACGRKDSDVLVKTATLPQSPEGTTA